MGIAAEEPRAGEREELEIPRGRWREALDAFTRRNRERAGRLETPGDQEIAPQILIEDRPFLSASVDLKAGEPQVVLEFGDTAGPDPVTFRHIVVEPTRLWEWRPRLKPWEALCIEIRNRGKLILTVNPHPGRGTLSLREVGRSELRIP